MQTREAFALVTSLLISAAGFIFSGPLLGVLFACLALYVAAVAWTPVGDWLGWRERPTREPDTTAAELVELPKIVFTLDGTTDLTVRIREDEPQAVLLEVGVANPNPVALRSVNANVLIPEGLRAGDGARCDHYGNHRSGGTWMRPTHERIADEPEPPAWKDYWAEQEISLTTGALLFIFKLHLSKSGNYYLRAKFWGDDLPEQIEQDAVLRVESADSVDELTARDLISEAIYQGEALLAIEPDAFTGPGPPQEWMGWVVQASLAVPEEHKDAYELRLKDGQGRSDWREQTREDLKGLYDIRARV
ncbi:MAG: hypothetical protein QOI10_2184 [Solirubrobacterales bacterium]|jgi:hypothetical protein|nr:hypothetical protein [Solirubrobacterales bacterium]